MGLRGGQDSRTRRHMKFSDRIGKTKPKAGLQCESMDGALRNQRWNLVDEAFVTPMVHGLRTFGTDHGWGRWQIRLWDEFFESPADTAGNEAQAAKAIRVWFFDRAEW